MGTGVERLRAAFRPGRPALVAYVPIGDPAAFDARTLDAYRDAGVAVLEVGIPTPDPWLDGPDVRGSMARALEARAHPGGVASTLAAWRAGHAAAGRATPAIVWFSYPDLAVDAIAAAASTDAVDALLMLEPWRHPEAASLSATLERSGVARCAFLPWIASDADRSLARAATGYLMVQARPGVTGAGGTPADPTDHVRAARALNPTAPVVAGFGVRDAASVARLATTGVDGVVVGSACIRAGRAGGAALRDTLRAFVAAAAGDA